MKPVSSALSRAFWAVIAASLLAACSSYAALVMTSANWAATQSLRTIYPNDETRIHFLAGDGMPIRSFTASDWARAQVLFTTGMLLLGGAWLLLALAWASGREQLCLLGTELRQTARSAWQAWRALPAWQRHLFSGHLLLLSLVRLFLSWTLIWQDDATSYDLFVQHGLLAVGAYYPLPNNHELSNLLALGFYRLYPAFWWSMRLPVLLVSTVATSLFFRILLRRLGYWPAFFAAGATSWIEPSLFTAGSGRGYWLVLFFTGLVFWALLTLLDPPGLAQRARPAWLVLVTAGVLGSYTMPTFAFVLLSAWSWLGGQALYRRQWAFLGATAIAGLLALGGIVACYSPTLYVSGWQALIANPYVHFQAHNSARLQSLTWQGLPAYLWHVEGYLGGQSHLGGLVGLLALASFGWTVWQAQAGRLSAAAQRQVQQVGWPALWFMLSMYLLLPVQQIFPPERSWLYKAWFGFIVLAVGLSHQPWLRTWRLALRVSILVFAFYQVRVALINNRGNWLFYTKRQNEFRWLAEHRDLLYPGARVAPASSPPVK